MRYILDERVGCAAVIDTKHPDYDPEYPGLHSDTKGVVLYEVFTNKSNLNISEYEIEEGRLVIERLKKDCKTLNDTVTRTKTEFVKCEYGDKVSNIIMDFENNAPLYKSVNDEYWTIDELDDLFQLILNDCHIYRKVETEVDERQEFIDASIELLNQNSHDNEANHYKEWFGAMYNSGKFKLTEQSK